MYGFVTLQALTCLVPPLGTYPGTSYDSRLYMLSTWISYPRRWYNTYAAISYLKIVIRMPRPVWYCLPNDKVVSTCLGIQGPEWVADTDAVAYVHVLVDALQFAVFVSRVSPSLTYTQAYKRILPKQPK